MKTQISLQIKNYLNKNINNIYCNARRPKHITLIKIRYFKNFKNCFNVFLKILLKELLNICKYLNNLIIDTHFKPTRMFKSDYSFIIFKFENLIPIRDAHGPCGQWAGPRRA